MAGLRTLKEQRAFLKAHGLRITPHRLLVVQCLAKAQRALSHREVVTALEQHQMDRVTIYRNLTALIDAGIITKHRLHGSVWRFQLPNRGERHHEHPHFLCTDCGAVSCLPSHAISLRSASIHHLEVTDIELRGRCQNCKRDEGLMG